LIFVLLSACGLNLRPFWLHLGLRPRYTALHAAYYAAALPVAVKMLMVRHHGDDVYMTSQLCCGGKGVTKKIKKKMKFSQTDDPLATFHLAHVPAM